MEQRLEKNFQIILSKILKIPIVYILTGLTAFELIFSIGAWRPDKDSELS